jgi:hypothetical protein
MKNPKEFTSADIVNFLVYVRKSFVAYGRPELLKKIKLVEVAPPYIVQEWADCYRTPTDGEDVHTKEDLINFLLYVRANYTGFGTSNFRANKRGLRTEEQIYKNWLESIKEPEPVFTLSQVKEAIRLAREAQKLISSVGVEDDEKFTEQQIIQNIQK